MSRLVIDLLGLEKGKAFGFQEYIFNLLNYFYLHRDDIMFERIIIWCKDISKEMFCRFENVFEVKAFAYSSNIRRLWLQSFLSIKYGLTKNDLLFSPGNYSGFIKCSSELLVIHDLLYKRRNWIPSKMMRLQREIQIPLSIKKADRIVAISHFTKEDLEHYYPQTEGRIEVIYNSVNFVRFGELESLKLGFDYFIAISSNYDYKNQSTILKAFQQYIERGGDKRLVIIGNINDGSEAAIVYGLLPISVKERISWKCNISNTELGALYRSASCFISASKFEGLGMPVVEAMSFGLPVLLSDIPPHREVSMEKGEYFEPTNVAELAEKMQNVDLKKRDYGPEVRKMFSEGKTSTKYVELINRIYVETHRGEDLKFRIELKVLHSAYEERRMAV